MTVTLEPRTRKARNQIEAWIETVTPGQTFCDLGGIGVNSCNERITFASVCGAVDPTMIDVRPSDFHEWETFRKICRANGLEKVREIDCADINDPQLREKVGTYHVVHSTGIFYHMPAPILSFENLTTIAERYLITNTVTVPDQISNRFGTLDYRGSQALFLPGISGRERMILREHYETNIGLHFDRDVAPSLDDVTSKVPYREEGSFSYWPYWWLLTESAFRSFFPMMGFRIIDEFNWNNHALCVFAERIERE